MEIAPPLQEGCPPLEDHVGREGGHKTDPKHEKKKKSERGTNIHKQSKQYGAEVLECASVYI